MNASDTQVRGKASNTLESTTVARKMGSRKRVKKNTLLVTADIGKATHYGYFRTPDGEDVKPFPVRNTRESFEEFWDKITDYKTAHGLEEVLFGFESTGPYAEPLTHFLLDRGAQLVQVNPSHTKRAKEIGDNSPEKSDKKDPPIIANIIEMGGSLTVIIPRAEEADLRRLVQARESFMRQRTMLYNRIHGLLASVFPENGKILDIKTKSAMWLFKNHPSPGKIVELGHEELLKNLKQVSRGSLKTSKIEALFRAAEQTIGVKEGLLGLELEISLLYGQVEGVEKAVMKLEREMEVILRKIPCSEYLLSIDGIGNVVAATLIGETGGFNRYKSAREVIKLAGLNLYGVSSGQYIGTRRISKRGRGLLRKVLYFAVLGMIRKGGAFHESYQRYLAEGKHKKSALIILARKLLVLAFALVRDKTHFNTDKEVNMRKAARAA